MPAIDVDRDAARDAAQRELAKAIYPKVPPLQRFTDWVEEQLHRLLQQASSMPGGWLTITVLLIALAAAAVIGIRIARRTVRTGHRDGYPLFGATELSASQHRAAAEACAAAGDWAAAIRHRLRAVARELEETGVLNPVPGRTANELARDAGTALPGLTSELAQATDAFNDVTYGGQPGTPTAYRMVVDLDDRLRSGTRSGPSVLPERAPFDSWAQVR